MPGTPLLALLLLISMPVSAGQVTEAGRIERLQPGEALVAPAIAPAGPVTIVVSLSSQRIYVYRNGVPIAVSTISSGKPGHETPTGVFTILAKSIKHFSNKYDNAPMPYMQRLTWDGVALHAGHLPGYAASHGCIRLPLTFARWLFDVTDRGAMVVVTAAALAPEEAPSAQPTAESPREAARAADEYVWRPDRSASGPVSLLISGRDAQLVVLRNGVEIARAAVALRHPVTTTAAFVLRGRVAGKTRWVRLPLPGDVLSDIHSESFNEELAAGDLPEAFRNRLLPLLLPGVTLLVTRGTLATSGTGAVKPIEVVDNRSTP